MAFEEIRLVDAGEFGAEGSSLAAAVEGVTYAMHADGGAELAGLYRGQLGAQVRRLEALLRSADPNMRAARARLRN